VCAGVRSVTLFSMNRTDTPELHDAKVDVKIKLSGLWIAMLMVFAYVDIFGFWRADLIQGVMDKKVPGPGFAINQTFLTLTTLYILIPSLMIVVSLFAPARVNRVANIAVSLIYALTVIGSMIGESWLYYLIGSAVEVVLLLMIAATARNWPKD
jgi:Family of unknown function (DUF6326)